MKIKMKKFAETLQSFSLDVSHDDLIFVRLVFRSDQLILASLRRNCLISVPFQGSLTFQNVR